jgi:2'-5' RNA ligase
MPDGEVCERLKLILRRLSARHEAPQFPPHVTVLGSCLGERDQMIRQASLVAATLRPFSIHLGEIGFRDEYFRGLFVHAGPLKPLREAHEAVCRGFGRTPDPDFMPHLSLLYGNYPLELKRDIISSLGDGLEFHFDVRSLHLYHTHGPVEDWRRVDSFAF